MDFTLTEDQIAYADSARQFAEGVFKPNAAQWDAEHIFPKDALKQAGELGFMGLYTPEEAGGLGMSRLDTSLIVEELAKGCTSTTAFLTIHNMATGMVGRYGQPALIEEICPGLVSGEKLASYCLTEPGAGSDAGNLRSTARRDGDDYVLNGRKLYITNGPVADVLLVYAKTDRDRGAKGISAFVVEKDFPGFGVAQKLNKMGFRGSQTGELVFDDCRVPAANMVGEENRGHVVVMSGLDLERAMISPICLGISERALELSVEYARERKQFGKPIASFQMVQSHIADMYTWVEAIRLFTYRGLSAVNNLVEGEGGRGDVHKLSAASVMFTANMMNRVLDLAVQVHGGIGYIWESEINRLYRHTKLLEIGAGTTEVRKMIIAEEVLK